MTRRSSIQASVPGPDRSRKRHETIAPSNHHLPFLPVRSSRPVWLLTWCAPRRLPRGEFSCHVKGGNFSFHLLEIIMLHLSTISFFFWELYVSCSCTWVFVSFVVFFNVHLQIQEIYGQDNKTGGVGYLHAYWVNLQLSLGTSKVSRNERIS